jgi:hypothetical protein
MSANTCRRCGASEIPASEVRTVEVAGEVARLCARCHDELRSWFLNGIRAEARMGSKGAWVPADRREVGSPSDFRGPSRAVALRAMVETAPELEVEPAAR